MLRLYNSLTRSKEDFTPIKAGIATIYSCGPTVYDHVHIGNLRSFIVDDLLQRTLRHIENLDVTWVMNITDIDDKMIGQIPKTSDEPDSMVALGKLADKYTDIFIDDIEKVGINRGDINKLPRATDNIDVMQELIKHLLQEGIAYVSQGSIYFSIEKYTQSGKKYGQLVNLDFDSQARVTDDQDQKEGVGDFALWKAQKVGEPAWDFAWQGINYPGRPGWHIECSAMSTKYLGQPFDIHTGGVDLKFPHHENELAQCGGVQAKYYIHNEFLNISGEKMSKSLGNITKIETMPDPMAFRLLVLQAHYRSQMDYSSSALQSAHERLNNLRAYVENLVLSPIEFKPSDASRATAKFVKAFKAALEDDLNTPSAIAALSGIEGKVYTQESTKAIELIDSVLGLGLLNIEPLTSTESKVLNEYVGAREQRNFTKSDKLRNELKAKYKIVVADTSLGCMVSRLHS